MRAGRTLRRVIMDRLVEQVPGVAGRVYDRAAETTKMPYITLGPSYWADASVECIEARDQTVQVDVWDAATTKGSLEDIVDDVADALDGWADTEVLAMHPLRVSLVRVMDDPGGGLHGIVQVEAMVEG